MYIKKSRLKTLLVIAILAASASQVNSVFAESSPISGKDMLDQAVALYEKLTDDSVALPQHLSEYEVDDYVLKSVVLGYINLDEAQSPSLLEYARKQDVMNLLYKTVINYDDSYTLSDEEASQILNECYDNAYIDEENKIAYAFMLKHGIIDSKVDTQPNKLVTWDSCRILVDIVYDYFVKEITFTVNNTPITMGANFATLPESFSSPDRIDVSDYGYDWYVYNSDSDNFCMLGVENGRICGFFTNAKEFSINSDISKGDDIAAASELVESQNVKLFADSQNRIESVLYTSRENGHEEGDEYLQARIVELLDIINAKRLQEGKEPYELDNNLSNAAWLKSLDMIESHKETNESFFGCDIFHIYSKLISGDNPIIFKDTKPQAAIGIDATLDSDIMYSSFVIDETIDAVNNLETENDTTATDSYDESFTIIPSVYADNLFLSSQTIDTDNLEAPELSNPVVSAVSEGENIVLDLKKPVSSEYQLEVYDLEKGTYTVNSYINTTEDIIEIPAEILTGGVDYNITLSSIGNDGEKLSSETILVSYGDPAKANVTITTEGGKTDNDYIALNWESEQFVDFYVDVYNSNGDLIVSTIFENEYEALIQGLDPDKYFVYVTALRKGTTIEKAQDSIEFEITLPEPVINEFILDEDDKYYFVYEDKKLGVLYFYDEEIIEVEEGGKTVKKKKIIQKQVKDTKAYRRLSEYQIKLEYITGEPISMSTSLNPTANAIVSEAKKYLGVPYVWGGASPDGFDCSGLVHYIYKSLGISIDRVTYEQVENGYKIEQDSLAPGDLIFFKNDSDYVNHVGIYIGNNKFIHAPHTGDVVKISELSGYYLDNYYEARRVY